MEKGTVTHSPQLRSTQTHYNVRINTQISDDYLVCTNALIAIIDSIIAKIAIDAPPYACGYFSLGMTGLDRQINMRFNDIKHLNAIDLMNAIVKTLNSNEEASLNNFVMSVVFINRSVGGENTPGLNEHEFAPIV